MKNFYLIALLIISCVVKAQVTQPTQPLTGHGSNSFTHGGVTTYDYGTNKNGDGFWIYEPASPKPDSANVIVFIHGWGMVNPRYYGAYINRLVRQGNIVIYPRYQKAVETSNATYTDTCAKGIQRALDTLLNTPGHVAPRLYNYFITGHSMGGVLTANMTTRYAMYNLPKPLAALSMQPGADIAALLLTANEYATFPADVKYLIITGDNDAVVDSTAALKIFNQTTAVPTSHKNHIRHFADNHGTPAIAASHGEPGAKDDAFDTGETNLIIAIGGQGALPDAVDYYCYWKLWDALVDCALNGSSCDVAFGDTYAQKFMGNWSDGTPVRPLKVTPAVVSSINNLTEGQGFHVFPNPFSNELYIETNNFTAGTELQIELVDIAGRKVAEQKITSDFEHFNINIPAGIYFYRISNDGKTVGNGKLVAE